MKFECKGEMFIKSIQQVAKARSKVQSKNYLQDIHLQLDEHLLTIRATNLEIFCEKSIAVKGISNGVCLIQGETLLRILSTFQTLDVTLACEVIEGVFTITNPQGVIEIKTTTYEDFPTLPQQGDVVGVLDKNQVNSLLREVHFCAATTEIKPEIASVFLFSKDKNLYAVATDSYRLAEKTIPNINNIECSVLLPQKHITDILQILNEEEGDITLSKYEGIFSFTSEHLTLSIHTILGNFPDYQQLFPKEFTTEVSVPKNALQKALTLTTFFNETYSKVECVFTENKLTLHSKNESVGQVTHTIDTKKTGDDVQVTYNNKYFLDALSHIQGETLVCKFSTPNRPMFITSKEDISFTYLLMPLNR